MANKALCSIPDCGKKRNKREWCLAHYTRWLKHGSPDLGGTPNGAPLAEMMRSIQLAASDKCWEWPYSRLKRGYGKIYYAGSMQLVHRVVCAIKYGPPPSNLHEAAHECGNAACINWQHISWKTHRENESDKVRHGTQFALKGEDKRQAKLTEDKVLQIRKMYESGLHTHRSLATKFSVSRGTINAILTRKRWKCVP